MTGLSVYIETAVVIGAALAAAHYSAKALIRKYGFALAGEVLILVVCLALDPYSFGATGGEGIATNSWQPMIAVASVILLVSTMLARHHHIPRVAWAAALVECTLFLSANIYYVHRDGVWTRALTGYTSSPLPLAVVIMAGIVRVVLLSKLAEDDPARVRTVDVAVAPRVK